MENFDDDLIPDVGDTAPIKNKRPFFADQKTVRAPSAMPKQRRFPWILISFLVLIVLLIGGAYLGYSSALRERLAKEQGNLALTAATQYQLALDDQAAGRFAMAKKRLEYIINIDPHFPGASDKLVEIMVLLSQVATTTPQPTPTIQATPDTRGQEELFTAAQQTLINKDWDGTIAVLDSLRKKDLTYRAVEVDGMYYIALRYQGIEKIIKEGNLEGGIYSLTLSSRFGPLDREAEDYRNYARQYLNGYSFWVVDWGKVVQYFSQIYPSLPNLRDGSGVTAQERYRIASLRYAEQLAMNLDYCGAEPNYLNALALGGDQYLQMTATQAALYCRPAPTAGPTSEATIAPTNNSQPVVPPGITPQPPVEPTVEVTTEVAPEITLDPEPPVP